MMQKIKGALQSLRNTVGNQDLMLFIIVFSVDLVALKLGQYIFYTFNTSPAVIIPAVGVSFAAVLLGGYKMAIPLALAQAISQLTSPVLFSPLVITTLVIAYPLQAVIGTYILRLLGFKPEMSRTKDAIMIVAGALVFATIAPTIVSAVRFLLGELVVSFWISWSRVWAGSVLSIMILTPFISTWLTTTHKQTFRKRPIEKFSAGVLLIGITYVIFWTRIVDINVFVFLYIFIFILFWIGLRMGPRITTLALVVATTLGVIGTFTFEITGRTMAQRLLSVELFLVLVAPIFLILSALVEERRAIAEAFKENIKKLEDALRRISSEDAAKNEFIAILAHELRNPLAPIVSAFEILKFHDQNDEALEVIADAESNTATMKRLLDDLLDVTRVARKKFTLRKEVIEVRQLIDQSAQTVGELMKIKHHTLVVSAPPERILLFVDPVRFKQVIVNLLTNAAKYTPESGHIELRASVSANVLTIEVEDNGMGIPTNHLETIFDPFRQVPTDNPSGGLGIGLYLTKKLLEMHGGTISVTSDNKRGSTFTIKLPLGEVPAEQTTSIYTQSTTPITENSSYSILLVDDNEAAAKGLSKLLEYRGYKVSIAHTGLEALVHLSSHHPDFIILDIGLPDISGYEVAEEIQNRNIPSVLIALTGYGQEEDRKKAKDSGFDYHLVKPVSIHDVELVLGEAKKVYAKN